MNKLSTKEVMRFAVPVALENLMSQLIGMLVPILIGGISGSALAAVGMGNTVLSLFTSCFAMMSTGGAVLLARAIGAGEKEDASRIGGQSVLMAIVMSMVFAGVFWVIARPVMRLLMPTAEDNMFAEAVLYFRYMMISFPGLMVYSVGTALLRASGTTRGPMMITIAFNVVLIAVAALMIRVLNLGIDGAGIAYAAARIIGAALTVALLIKQRGAFRLKAEHIIRVHFATWKRILRIGIPASMESALVQAGYLVGNALAVGLGTHEATVYQVLSTVYGFASYPQTICSTILVSFIGQMVGAGLFADAKKTARRVYYAGMGVTVVMAALLMIFIRPLSAMYTSDPEVMAGCIKLTWIILATTVPAFSINGTDPGLRAGGDVRFVMIYTIIGVWAVRVPLTWLFCYPMGMGVLGVFLANIVSLSLRALTGQIRFFSGKWIHKNI